MAKVPHRKELRGPFPEFGSNSDSVSDRADSERTLLESEQKQRAIFSAMAEGLVVHDATGAIVQWNKAAEKILGLTGDQISGKSSLDPQWRCIRLDGSAFPGDEHPAMISLATGLPQTDVPMGIVHKNGTTTWISINSVPVFAHGGHLPDAVAVTFRDVTARFDQEKKLVASESRTRAIVDTVLDPIITIDVRGRITTFNPAAEKTFGYSAAEVLGKNVSILIPEPHHKRHSGYIQRYLDTKIPHIIGIGREVTGQRKNGEVFPMELAVAEIPSDDNSRFVGTIRDLTESKKLERMKDEFVATMSHEIRTPLNAIFGFTQLLLLDESLDASQIENLRHIRSSGEHLLSLVNDVLDLSKIESGTVEIAMEAVSVQAMLGECLTILKPMAQLRNVEIEVDESTTIGTTVKADPTRLRQVLINLVSNAIKYNRPQGSVKIACERRANGTLAISVEDEGPGIPAQKQAQLFQPFNRLGAELSDVEGTGIGLTITKSLVELMGGAIELRSELGRGSVFTVVLAIASASGPSVDRTRQDRAELSKLESLSGRWKILYVEDNPVNQLLIKALVQKYWIRSELVLAADGEQGLALAHAGRFDIVLLDINLPGISGWDVFDELHADERLAQIPVVAISANKQRLVQPEFLDRGFRAVLSKPVDVFEFVKTVDAILLGRLDTDNDLKADAPIHDEKGAFELPDDEAFDRIQFDHFAELLGERFLPLIEEFVGEIPSRLEKMIEFVREGKFDAARSIAHALKGACAEVGLALVSRQCQTIEKRCLAEPPDACALLEEAEHTLASFLDVVVPEYRSLIRPFRGD